MEKCTVTELRDPGWMQVNHWTEGCVNIGHIMTTNGHEDCHRVEGPLLDTNEPLERKMDKYWRWHNHQWT